LAEGAGGEVPEIALAVLTITDLSMDQNRLPIPRPFNRQPQLPLD